ncbi:MAG: sulfatase-like hydrolase/transferase [Myxococcales bacterium]|nr:sulfatase-like hydrolase/transferase [Myxococcales bacterium]MBK7196598.1 sulfatase-like hydrolase/transferase [Myxococcales bacterium]
MAEAATPSFASTRAAFAAGAGAALCAALILAVIDGVVTGGGAMITVLGLWGLPAFGFALYAGAVAAGFSATFGPGAIGRLKDDPERDAAWAGAVVAVLLVGVAIAILVPTAAMILVAKAHRPEAGARVMGPVVMLLALGAGLAIVPIARLARAGARSLPVIAGVPRFVQALIVAIPAALVFARRALYGAGFDNAALPMGAIAEFVMLPVLTLVLGAVALGPLAAVRAKVPARGPLVGVGLALALVLGGATLTRQPSAAVAKAVTEKGIASRTIVFALQTKLDADGDGFSAFFRGPDCDDHDKGVNPNQKEIAGNGKDDNCQGGDRAAEPVADGGTPPAPDGGAAPLDAGVAAPAAAGKNVVIVMIDTVRVDRLGKSGYQRDGKSLTPRIDAFLDQAVWFKRTYAQANNTPRSMPSFMASRYPSLVKVDKLHSKYPRVDDANVMLFEQLQAAGLTTLGVASHFYFRDERNFTQGFTSFDNDGALDIGPSNKDVASPRIVPRAVAKLAELGTSKQRFAMFVHLFEPHSSFVEHEGFPPVTETGTKAHAHRYDYELAFVDGWVGQLLDGLAAAGLDQDTVVVLMSDHGEAFGEHNFGGQSMFHGTNLYDEQLRVPFAFRVPGAAPRAVDDVVQLIDLAPTVAELAGAKPDASWLGRSLVPAIQGGALPPKPAFAELLAYPGWEQDLKMAVSADGAWKLINVLSQRRMELYDLAGDPGEQRDRWNDASAAAAKEQMQKLLLDWVEVTLAE